MAGMPDIIASLSKAMKASNSDIIFNPNRKIERIESGCLIFNQVSGGGYPRGRITEIFGMEHSGKSSELFGTAAAAQRADLVGVLIDAETAWDPAYAKRTYGLVQDNKTFTVFQPDNIEQCDAVLTALEALTRIDYIMFDSVDAMKPKSLLEGSLDQERRVGAHAQAMSRFVAKAKVFAKKKNAALIFINQMRTNIQSGRSVDQNVGTGAGFNPMETYTTTGGLALRFYASLRIKLEYGGRYERADAQNALTGEADAKARIGNLIKVINIKNKTATPFMKGMATFVFPTESNPGGWHNGRDMLELLKKRGIVQQRATKFVYKHSNGTEWSNIASVVASEEKFLADPALVTDAMKQLAHLTENKVQVMEVMDLSEISPEDLQEVDPNTITDLSDITIENGPQGDPDAVTDEAVV